MQRSRNARGPSLGADVLAESAPAAFDPASVATMLVRTGSARVVTSADVFAAADALAAAAEARGGFVERREDEGGYVDDNTVHCGNTADVSCGSPVSTTDPHSDQSDCSSCSNLTPWKTVWQSGSAGATVAIAF